MSYSEEQVIGSYFQTIIKQVENVVDTVNRVPISNPPDHSGELIIELKTMLGSIQESMIHLVELIESLSINSSLSSDLIFAKDKKLSEFEKQVEGLKQTIKDKNKKIQDLEDEIDEHSQNYQQDIELYEREFEELRKEKDELQALVLDLTSKEPQSEDSRREFKRIKSLIERNEKLRKELDHFEMHMEGLRVENLQFEKKIDMLETDMSRLREERGRARRTLTHSEMAERISIGSIILDGSQGLNDYAEKNTTIVSIKDRTSFLVAKDNRGCYNQQQPNCKFYGVWR